MSSSKSKEILSLLLSRHNVWYKEFDVAEENFQKVVPMANLKAKLESSL